MVVFWTKVIVAVLAIVGGFLFGKYVILRDKL